MTWQLSRTEWDQNSEYAAAVWRRQLNVVAGIESPLRVKIISGPTDQRVTSTVVKKMVCVYYSIYPRNICLVVTGCAGIQPSHSSFESLSRSHVPYKGWVIYRVYTDNDDILNPQKKKIINRINYRRLMAALRFTSTHFLTFPLVLVQYHRFYHSLISKCIVNNVYFVRE